MSNVIHVEFRSRTIESVVKGYMSKRTMSREDANKVLEDYAKSNYTSVEKVVGYWIMNETRGAVKCYWPDINIACQVVTEYPVDSSTVISHI